MPQSRLDADRALQKGKDGLEVGIAGIDAVVALPALGFRAQEAVALKAGELAGDVGGVGADCRGQLADVGAGGKMLDLAGKRPGALAAGGGIDDDEDGGHAD